MIEEREPRKEERTRRGGRRDEGGSKDKGGKVIGEEKQKISLALFKATGAPDLFDISQRVGVG